MNVPSFDNPVTQRIVEFLAGIGFEVRREEVHEPTFLPGIMIDRGALVIDEEKLSYPGDLLHEAGHIAVVPPSRRRDLVIHAGDDGGEEMMAIAWSYAAAVHMGLDMTILFHEGGYRGWSSGIIDNFAAGRYSGVPTLQWIGLTYDEKWAAERGVPPFPHMIAWFREEELPAGHG